MKVKRFGISCCCKLVHFLILAGLSAAFEGEVHSQAWELVWSDEFDGPPNTAPDSTKWGYQLGGGGWGNRELEVYTNSLDNVFLDGSGNLVIKAIKGADGVYTSGRLLTKGRFEPQFGRIEARIKIPFGQGIWPAFWMLGNDIDSVGWPACGEIDIMENIGREPSMVHGSMHGPGYSGATPITRAWTLPDGARFSDAFHTFAIQWAPDSVQFFIDDNPYYSVTPASLPSGTRWAFNKPFYILLNLAVGGNWPGYPDENTVFPQAMTIDYVRVFKRVECGYGLDSASRDFAALGGTGTVNVAAPAPCEWTASSNVSWMTVSLGSSGKGDGTVNYIVAVNRTSVSRTGSLTIAGQSFTVNQAAPASRRRP